MANMTKKQRKEMIKSPKGMHDMLHEDIRYLEKILEAAKKISEFYGFLPIATPHLEYAELFLRPLGESSDVVEKEMYSFRTCARGRKSRPRISLTQRRA